jgi:hypothetical protein
MIRLVFVLAGRSVPLEIAFVFGPVCASWIVACMPRYSDVVQASSMALKITLLLCSVNTVGFATGVWPVRVCHVISTTAAGLAVAAIVSLSSGDPSAASMLAFEGAII